MLDFAVDEADAHAEDRSPDTGTSDATPADVSGALSDEPSDRAVSIRVRHTICGQESTHGGRLISPDDPCPSLYDEVVGAHSVADRVGGAAASAVRASLMFAHSSPL